MEFLFRGWGGEGGEGGGIFLGALFDDARTSMRRDPGKNWVVLFLDSSVFSPVNFPFNQFQVQVAFYSCLSLDRLGIYCDCTWFGNPTEGVHGRSR